MSDERTPCFICDKPSRYRVREEGDPQTHWLCVPCYRLAVGLAKLSKGDS